MRARKNRAFFIETLIITFLLLLMLTILVRIFGAAAQKSQNAGRMTRASVIAQNVITMFENSEGEIGKAQNDLIIQADEAESFDEIPNTELTFSFNEKGEEDPDGEYEVRLRITCEVRAVGYMLTGIMNVVCKDDPENDLSQLDTAKYFPDAADRVLTGDIDISFDDFAEVSTEAETEPDMVYIEMTETEVAS